MVFLTAMRCIRECRADGCDEEETKDHVRAAVGVEALDGSLGIDINPDNLALILAFLETILPILIQVFFTRPVA